MAPPAHVFLRRLNRAAQALAEHRVAMVEEAADDRCDEPAGDARFERQSVCQHAAGARARDAAFVAPGAHAGHRRLMKELPAGSDYHNTVRSGMGAIFAQFWKNTWKSPQRQSDRSHDRPFSGAPTAAS